MPVSKYVKILTAFLFVACFFERFFFLKSVYKTKNYGCVLITFIVFLNTIFLFVIKILRKRKNVKKLHEVYNIHEEPKAAGCVIFVLGFFDIGKSFCIIWPSNTMPIWLFLSILQLKIPLNLLLRTCCIDQVENYKQTWASAILIFIGTIINAMSLSQDSNRKEDGVSTFFISFYSFSFS